MITATEAGLTDAEYAAVQAATGDLQAQVVLQRYGPVWSARDVDAWTDDNFDAILVGAYILKAYAPTASDISTVSDVSIIKLPSEPACGDEAWANIPGAPADVDVDVPVSLATDGSTVRLFYYSNFNNNIRYVQCNDVGSGSFGASVNVGAVTDLQYLAAVSLTKVHYVTKTAKSNRRLHFYEDDGGWAATDSDIYWPFPIYAMDAVAMTSFDLLVFSTEMAPYLGSRAVGAEVTTEANRVQGIVSFHQSNGRWSDHDAMDVIDIIETDPSRASVRLSLYNGYLFASYRRCGGLDSYTYSKAAVMRSRDGYNWEFPEIIEDVTAPLVIIPRSAGGRLYAVGRAGTWCSPPCVWAGMTTTEVDFTEYVLSLESQSGDIRNTNLKLSNPADVLDGTLAKTADRVQAVYDLGYYDDTEGSLLVQTSVEDLITWADRREMPKRALSLRTRDRLGRANRIRSDHAAEFPSMQAGRDEYDDPTGTGYGGLRHTAPYEASWKAEDGECTLLSSLQEGLTVSTFVSDALCGSAQTGIYLDTESQEEYAGISFHVYDKDNLFFAAYYLDDDVIRLRRRIGGQDVTLSTSGAMSWAVDTWYWLKVVVRYSWVDVYYSTDGLTWTLTVWDTGTGECDGAPDRVGTTTWTMWSGKFGLIGYGYSPDDEWPSWDPVPWPGITPAAQNYGLIVISEAELGRSWNFFDLSATCAWDDILGSITGTLYHIAIGSSGQAWLTSSDGLWYTGNILASTVSWSCAVTDAAATAESGLAGVFCGVDITPSGVVYAPWHGNQNINRGYYSGTAGALAYSAFPQYDPPGPLGLQSISCDQARRGFSVYCGDGVPRIGVGAGSNGRGLIWADDVYTQFANDGDGNEVNCIRRDGYVTTHDGLLYSGYSPASLVLDMNTAPVFGFGALSGSLLYYINVEHDVYRDGALLATAATIWGAAKAFGRVDMVRENPDEIVGVIASDALGGGGQPAKFIVYTTDAFINYHDRTGDFATAVGTWSATSGEDMGNASFAVFPYTSEDH